MSAVNTSTQNARAHEANEQIATKISWKLPITYAIATLICVWTAFQATGTATYRFNQSSHDKIQIADWHVNAATLCWVLVAASALAFLYSLLRAINKKKPGIIPAAVCAFAVVFSVLTWQGGLSTGAITITATLTSALALSTPLIFGSLSGVVAERSGVVNIAIEGQLLIGAFAGVVVASVTHNVWIGLVAAPLAGVLLSLLLALFAVGYNVDHIIVGVVLNTLALGLTTFFFSTVLSENPEMNSASVNLKNVKIPLLGDIPIIGPVFFNQTVLTYLMYAVIIILTIYLFRSRWGLRLRACGEHPHAADTVGINVRSIRVKASLLSGALAGLGGAYFTIGASIGHSFNNNMSAGNGYIALAAMILGKWHPLGAVGAAVMFGFAKAVAILMPTLNLNAPSNLINMIPYIVTVLAVAGFVGKSRPPASENVPYEK